jgi:hypothetical protein
VLSYLPTTWLLTLVQLLSQQSADHAKITAKLIHSSVALNTLTMANHEMETIRELDYNVLNTFMSHIIFYYGTTDQWVPLRMWKEVRSYWPEGTLLLG